MPGILAVVFLAPLLMAWTVFYLPAWRPDGALQHGELLLPVRQIALPVPAAGVRPNPDLFHGRWTLLYRSAGVCDVPCQSVMETLRRVRLAQGSSMRMVQRVLVVPPSVSIDTAAFLSQDSALQLVRAGQWGLATGSVYLVDPQGNLILRYSPGFDPIGLLKDLQRLLRLSGAG